MNGKLLKIKDLIKNNKTTSVIFTIMMIIIISCGTYIKHQNSIITTISNANNNSIKEDKSTIQSKQTDKKETLSTNTDKEIKIGEPFSVNTSNGNYKFTIQKAVKSDEFNKWDKEIKENNQLAIELFLECENIDFHNEKYKGVMMYDAFNVKDNNNYNLQHYSRRLSNFSDGHEEILPNSKSKICLIYIGNKDSTSVTVSFTRGGNVTIPLEQ